LLAVIGCKEDWGLGAAVRKGDKAAEKAGSAVSISLSNFWPLTSASAAAASEQRLSFQVPWRNVGKQAFRH
jgi:hypothetical protein